MNSLTVALAGNPNVGKSVLFNSLTGARQHVANWPGVTIEKKYGLHSLKDKNITVKVVDLPGIYSLSSYSMEEVVTRDFITKESPDILINVVDASNIERNLYLTMQLLELNKPMIIALNMIDVAQKQGIVIDIAELEKKLGVPVIPIVAIKGIGIEDLMSKAVVPTAKRNENKEKLQLNYDQHIEEKIETIIHELDSYPDLVKDCQKRWLAIRLLEGDNIILDKLKEINYSSVLQKLNDINLEGSLLSEIVENRYKLIANLIEEAVVKTTEEHLTLTDKIDRVVLNRVLGIPIFLLLMWIVFLLTFDLAGNPLVGLIDDLFVTSFIPSVTQLLNKWQLSPMLISIVSEGIIGGVGSVLIFVPQIFILFFFIAFLEDSGYMARAAFIMDRVMRRIGLNGKAFIPMLLGFGCSVPAIMTARTLENENDRKVTILLTPFMSCSARLPVYLVFVTVFFPTRESGIIFSLYLLGIAVAVGLGLILKLTTFKSDYVPFILELPPYRIPTLTTILLRMWDRGKIFLIKAGTIIFGMSVIIWWLSNFSLAGSSQLEDSFLASIGKIVAPVFAPLGFDSWQAAVAILSGFLAKEVVITTMAVIYGIGDLAASSQEVYFHSVISSFFTPLSAYSFMVFVLLYTPCIATLATIKRETGSYKWTIFAMAVQFVLAWVVAFLIYQVGLLLNF